MGFPAIEENCFGAHYCFFAESSLVLHHEELKLVQIDHNILLKFEMTFFILLMSFDFE